MFAVRRLFFLLLIVALAVLFSACQDGSSTASGSGSRSIARNFQWLPLFGDGVNDASDTIARVGDIEITSRDLDLYLDELPSSQQNRYMGPDGKRLLLKRMVNAVLMVQGSVEKKLYNDPDVARTIITQRRIALESAMLNYGLLRGREPTEDEVREYFQNYRSNYRQLGVVQGRHIECKTEKAAQEAYRRLIEGGRGNDWVSVVMEVSVNEESRANEGNVGWFNENGVIPIIPGSKIFTKKAFHLEIGVNPPFQIVDLWHVVEITDREFERPMTFPEAKAQAKRDMKPAWQDGIIKDFLLEARERNKVELAGDFAPGKGLSADELFSRAMAVGDAELKIELLNLIHSDYPESDRADDALFMSANIAMETWADGRVASRYLLLLLEEYPDSELAEDARYLKDNLYNPKVMNPKSMEDLRK